MLQSLGSFSLAIFHHISHLYKRLPLVVAPYISTSRNWTGNCGRWLIEILLNFDRLIDSGLAWWSNYRHERCLRVRLLIIWQTIKVIVKHHDAAFKSRRLSPDLCRSGKAENKCRRKNTASMSAVYHQSRAPESVIPSNLRHSRKWSV